MAFPRNRFQAAGATLIELDALEAEHDALPDRMRAANEQHFDTLDTAGLIDALEVRRAAGIHLEVVEPTEELADDEAGLESVRALLSGTDPPKRRTSSRSRPVKAK